MDERLEEPRRQLDQKTTEIESFVAAEQGMGSIENMEASEYERLEQTVDELLGRWEETAQEGGPGGMDDTPLNRLIVERFEIEQMILATRGEQPEGADVEGGIAGGEECLQPLQCQTRDWSARMLVRLGRTRLEHRLPSLIGHVVDDLSRLFLAE
jgi:hypothetical protein